MTLGEVLGPISDYLTDGKIGTAVSGGGDSVALLRILADAVKDLDVRIVVYTVDHGLRPEAADEVRFVKDLAVGLGCEHRALSWEWDGQGNVSAAARQGRYEAISDAAKQDGVGVVLLGHTKDDQAETVLMALARSAGVDGLAGMQPVKQDRDIQWHRPLLQTTRAELRAYLNEIGQSWIDDPTNDNEAYERVRVRNAAETLAGLGLSVDALSDVAANMQSARQALESAAKQFLRLGCTERGGAVRIDRALFSHSDFEIQRRVMAKCLAFVAPLASAPRRSALVSAINGHATSNDMSLSGCLVMFKKDHIWVVREPNAVVKSEAPVDGTWDGKWRLSGPEIGGNAVIRALGESGLASCNNWRETDLPRPVLLSSPSIWLNDRLIAAPLASYGANWSAEMLLRAEDFLS